MLLNIYFAIANKIIIFFHFFCDNYLLVLKKSTNFVVGISVSSCIAV